MRKQVWILLIVGVFALGLVAAGCGDDDSSSTEVTVEDTDASTTVSDGDTSVTAEDTSTSSDSGGSSSPDDVARAVRFVLESPAITGTTIVVDGGQLLPEGNDFRIAPKPVT